MYFVLPFLLSVLMLLLFFMIDFFFGEPLHDLREAMANGRGSNTKDPSHRLSLGEVDSPHGVP